MTQSVLNPTIHYFETLTPQYVENLVERNIKTYKLFSIDTRKSQQQNIIPKNVLLRYIDRILNWFSLILCLLMLHQIQHTLKNNAWMTLAGVGKTYEHFYYTGKYYPAILLYVPLDLEQQKYIFLVLQVQVFKTKYATYI